MSPKPILCASVLTVILAGCGGADGSGQNSGQGSPQSSAPQSSAQPQASAAPQSGSGSAAPVATEDGQPNSNGDAPATDGEATDANGQTENYYGQAAPPAQNQDDPQAQWKEQRDAAPAG